ncbi:helix-turn-helix domain-containing protein [Chloroflexota bacterium]
MEKGKFGSRLRNLRQQAHLTQRELADKVGVNYSYLSKIESGVMPPPSEELILRLAEILNVDKDELLSLAGRIPSDITEMLRDGEILGSLRGKPTKRKDGIINKDSFGERLKELREKAGLSQGKLAETLGISFTYLSKLESGAKPPPSRKVIIKLAEALHCDKDDLIVLAGKLPSDITRMLRNRETLHSIREGRINKKKRGFSDKVGRIGMKEIFNYKALSRVVVPIILVCAVAVSLWYAAPTAALQMEFTNPETGSIGGSYLFDLEITIEDQELLPIENIGLYIYKEDNETYSATCSNLPLINGGSRIYLDADTGGGGAVNVTAVASSWGQLSGYGYAVWGGYAYQFGYGYGYGGPSSITYSCNWTPPVDWPEGNYIIKATITADSTTFTKVSDEFALSTEGATVGISVGLEGFARPPVDGWVIPITVKFYEQGTFGTAIPPYPDASHLHSRNATTVRIGGFATANISGIPAAFYDITVQSEHTLMNVQYDVEITQPFTQVGMGTLVDADADGDHWVFLLDFNVLKASFGKVPGMGGYDARADFDRDNFIFLPDFNLLKQNFGKYLPTVVIP